MRGLSEGAYAMYHAWSRSRSSILCATYFSPFSENTCAVPVLPPLTLRSLGEGPRRGALPGHADQRVLDEGDVLRLDRDGV